MDYRCIRHLAYQTKDHTEDFLTVAIPFLKAKGMEDEEACSTIAATISTGDGTYTKAILDALQTRPEGGGGTATAKSCKAMCNFLSESGIRCECSDCKHDKGNKGRVLDPVRDMEVTRWCICDPAFLISLSDDKETEARIRHGLFSTPVLLINEPDYSFACPLYLHLYRTAADGPYRLSLIVGAKQPDNYEGLCEDVINRVLAEHFPLVPEQYKEKALVSCRRTLEGLNDPSFLVDRKKVQSYLDACPAAEKNRPSRTKPKPAAAQTAKKQEPAATTQAAGETKRSALNAAKDKFRQETKNNKSNKNNNHNNHNHPDTEDSPEREVQKLLNRKRANEPMLTVYPLPDWAESTPLLTEPEDFERLFFQLVEGSVSRLPMEITEDASGMRSALIYVYGRASGRGGFYRIPQGAFQTLSASRVFSKAKPLTFLPFAVLSYFPDLRKCYSTCMAWNTCFMREEKLGPLGIIADTLGVPAGGEEPLKFQLMHAADCYNRLLARFTRKERKLYDQKIYQAVYRSTGYRLPHLMATGGGKEPFLFRYTGTDYVSYYNLHGLLALPGYKKYRVVLKDLPAGQMGRLSTVCPKRTAHTVFSGSSRLYSSA